MHKVPKLQSRSSRCLVVVGQNRDELERARLNERQEVHLGPAKSEPILSAAISFSTAIALLTPIIFSTSMSSRSTEGLPLTSISSLTVMSFAGEDPRANALEASATETGRKN